MPKVGTEYGSALYMLAKEEGSVQEIFDTLHSVKKLFDDSPDYITFLCTPGIPLDERRDAVKTAFQGRINDRVCSFLELLTERGHINDFNECVKEYEHLYNADLGIVNADAVSAVPLTDAEKAELTAKLEKMTGSKICLKTSVDSSLLGGILIRMNGKLLDGSLRTRINDIREVLMQ